jgi:lipopolysaccharide assembly outer membrane protein LptD (OstA)
MKRAARFVFLICLLCSPARAAIDEISLTADTMQYDIEAGRFYAEGNVTIKGGGITIIATHAIGRINSKTFNLSGNITIDGTWNGDDVKLSAISATAEIGGQSVYTLESGISGTVGKLAVDCDYLQIAGDNIIAKNVRKLQDQKAGITFSADDIKGKTDKGELTQAEAEGSIVIKGAPGKAGGVVELKGKKAVYSVARGTIVVSGGVSAVQNKRTLRADSVTYIPATNRIEAIGKPVITIDIDEENLSAPSPRKK